MDKDGAYRFKIQPTRWGVLSNGGSLHPNSWQSYAILMGNVVLTILKNISQWEGLYHILWKIQNV